VSALIILWFKRPNPLRDSNHFQCCDHCNNCSLPTKCVMSLRMPYHLCDVVLTLPLPTSLSMLLSQQPHHPRIDALRPLWPIAHNSRQYNNVIVPTQFTKHTPPLQQQLFCPLAKDSSNNPTGEVLSTVIYREYMATALLQQLPSSTG
jgi:hypothetical protein